MMFETQQCTLLIQRYDLLPDGALKLKPCVLIFHSERTNGCNERRSAVECTGQADCFGSAKGAELTFDRRWIWPGPNLAAWKRERWRATSRFLCRRRCLAAATSCGCGRRRVWLDRESIRTSNDVEFQVRRQRGQGPDSGNRLAGRASRRDSAEKKENGAVHAVSLKHLEYLRIATEGQSLLGSAVQSEAAKAPSSAPLEVKCQGEVTFDVTAQLARFEKQVEVRRLIPGAARPAGLRRVAAGV